VNRILSAFPLVLLPLTALAVDAAEPPAEANMVGTIVFLLLFVGGCAAFAWMIWRNEKKSKQNPGK
jgi:hypothetical protein